MPKGDTFTVGPGTIERITNNFGKLIQKIDAATLIKMKAATDAVYQIAHAVRPKVAAHKTPVTGQKSKAYRVSNPEAAYGVPVRTGVLQASLDKKVYRQGRKVIGEINAGGAVAPYATYVEFGTSRMAARPFMRPAAKLGQKAINAIFRGLKVTK
jgi:HK97 gp10 family phage protein